MGYRNIQKQYNTYCKKAKELGLEPKTYMAFYMALRRGKSIEDLYIVKEKKFKTRKEYYLDWYKKKKEREHESMLRHIEYLRKHNDGEIKTIKKGMKQIKSILY